MRIAISADHHVGANKFGTSNEKWSAPLSEMVDYVIDNKIDVAAFAGDMFHHRRPATWATKFVHSELERLHRAGVTILGADGNHDDGIVMDSVSATWHLNGLWARKRPEVWVSPDGVNVVLVPWITPQAYGAPSDLPLQEQLEFTQAAALESIKNLRGRKGAGILIGHIMFAYGPGPEDLAPSPGLQWAGKDCVMDYNTLANAFDYCGAGHVHDPRMKGYVGSSQPTDFGDAGQEKSFVVLDTEGMAETIIPYKTSLKLLDVKAEPNNLSDIDLFTKNLNHHYDVGRWHMHIPTDGHEPTPVELANVREEMTKLCDRVESIEVTKERTVVARIDTDTPLAAMRPEEAVDAWLTHAGTDAKTAKAVREKFIEMVEAGK